MRVLVTYGSKLGGTKEIAEQVGEVLRDRGLDAVVGAPEELKSLADYDAVIVGGALYAGHWPRPVRRFVKALLDELRSRPIWFFSSGPLDDSALTSDIPPTPAVDRTSIGHPGSRGWRR